MADFVKKSEYRDWLRDLKRQIKTGQIKAALSVNSRMIALYWDLGRQIAEKQEKAKWGSGFIEQLSKDLRDEFPDMAGFSLRNLQIIKQWYLFYSPNNVSKTKQVVSQLPEALDSQITQIVVGQLGDTVENPVLAHIVQKLSLIPWGHHVKIMQKVKDINQAFFYINKTIENNWSRAVLEYQVEFSLKDVNNPIGVSTFHYTELTDDIKAALPSAEELQNELLTFEREQGFRSALPG